jgi:ferric-dicitrate binding protein FerR (iron transport regulator)
MPLVDVVIQLNRYLETPLYVVDHGLNNLKLSGTFHIDNLEEIPELLPRLLPVTLRRSGDRVLILSSN